MTTSSRTTNILLIAMLAVGIAIAAMLATAALGGPLDPPGAPGSTDSVKLPGTPVTGPTTITQPGVYYLTRNISVSGATTAITISANNVTLDLGGFTIAGDDAAGSVGIAIGGNCACRVFDGRLRDFNIAIAAEEGNGTSYDGLQIDSSVRGIEFGSDARLENCTLTNIAETAILVLGQYSRIHNCHITDATTGVHITGVGVDVSGSTFSAVDLGVLASSSNNVITGNTFATSSVRGVELVGVSNRVTDNVFDCAAGKGVLASGAGSVVSGNICA